MSEPIKDCPQPETPIRERAWTAEQVEAASLVHSLPGGVGEMLSNYASLLRELRKYSPDNVLASLSVDYIVANGLSGDLMRNMTGAALGAVWPVQDRERAGRGGRSMTADQIIRELRLLAEEWRMQAEDLRDNGQHQAANNLDERCDEIMGIVRRARKKA